MDLAMVMPVYNEEACIAQVVCAWRDALARLGISFRILVLNDGSKDNTRSALATFAGDDRISVINKSNSGHGPTILLGYRQAIEAADWVFQCDSDDEMSPDAFPEFWRRREDYDALFGIRSGRAQSLARKIISAVSRTTVHLLFGGGVIDVNVPYRLMRAEALAQILPFIPADTFAPNVIISGAFARGGARIFNHPVRHEGRKTGAVSIMKWKLWRVAFRAFRQTLFCRPALIGRLQAISTATSSAAGGHDHQAAA
jgi:glycosyltransferase involved in cell wall biosynthesis